MPVKPRPSSGSELACRPRRAEEAALDFRAALCAQALELLNVLDAFRRRRHPEAQAEARDSPHDRDAVLAALELLHERAVDLDLVEREAAQVLQRRIPRAEIVHRDADAE